MRPLIPLVPFAMLLAPLLAPRLCAQEPKPSPDELLAAELASPFLTKAPWVVEFETALAQAKAKRQLIFAYFTTVGH